MINFALVDDHYSVRSGFDNFTKHSLFDGMELVWNFSSAQELLDAYENRDPELENFPMVIIIDYQMKDINGIDLVARLKAKYPYLKTIMHSSFYTSELIKNAVNSGADSYLSKDALPKDIAKAIRDVVAMGYHVNEDFPKDVILKLIDRQRVLNQRYDYTVKLTSKEMEVVKLIVEGKQYKEIGDIMNISNRTVEGHKVNISEKTGAKDRAEIGMYCTQRGWV